MGKRVTISKLFKSKENLSDSDQLKKKIFLYSLAEVGLIALLFIFSFFLFRVLVG